MMVIGLMDVCGFGLEVSGDKGSIFIIFIDSMLCKTLGNILLFV